MHWKKYFILIPPAILIAIILIFYLPQELELYTGAVPLIFWGVYYTWIYIEKKKKKDDIDKSYSEKSTKIR